MLDSMVCKNIKPPSVSTLFRLSYLAVLTGLVVYNGLQTFNKFFAKQRSVVTSVREPSSLRYPDFTICTLFKEIKDEYNVLGTSFLLVPCTRGLSIWVSRADDDSDSDSRP